MCLAIITKTYDPPLKRERWVWKVFDKDEYGIRFPYCSFRGTRRVKTDSWLKAPKTGWISDGCASYRRGFHVFDKRADAESYAGIIAAFVFRIKIRGIRTIGTEYVGGGRLGQILVCDEMFVPTPKPKKRSKAR